MKKFFLLIIVGLFFSGCMYYNYGVDAKNQNIKYETRYDSVKGNKYQFATTLLNSPNVGSGLYIEIRHLYKPYNKRDKEFISAIEFNTHNLTEGTVVEIRSIDLSHRTSDGKKIIAENAVGDVPKKIHGGKEDGVFYYKKIYSKNLPKNIIENISIIIKDEEGEYKIDYEFPLKYELEYTFWDVMLSG